MLQQNSNLPQLNIIRATAALMVTIYHLGGKTIFPLSYGWLGVEMFFVLTGFVILWALPINYTIADLGIFLKKRLWRIEPPYLISIAIVVSVRLIKKEPLDFGTIILHFGYLNNFFDREFLSPVYWTLGIEFQFYILIGVLALLMNNNRLLFIAILTLINLIGICYPSKYLIISNFMPYFTLGIACFFFLKNRLNAVLYYSIILGLAALIVWRHGLPQAVISLACTSIITFCRDSSKLIDFFSKISFSLYLTHDLVGSTFMIGIGNLFPEKTWLIKAFIFLIGFVCAVSFAYLFYKIIEIPSLKISKRFKYPSSFRLRTLT